MYKCWLKNHVATYMDKEFTEEQLVMYSENIYNLWVPAQNDPSLKFAAGKVIEKIFVNA